MVIITKDELIEKLQKMDCPGDTPVVLATGEMWDKPIRYVELSKSLIGCPLTFKEKPEQVIEIE